MERNNFETEFNRICPACSMNIIPFNGGREISIVSDDMKQSIYLQILEPNQNELFLLGFSPRDPRAIKVVCFRFRFVYRDSIPEIMVFEYDNHRTEKTDFLIFEREELEQQLKEIGIEPDRNYIYNLVLFILSDDFIFVVNNLGPEGIWYLSGTGRNTNRDLKGYLNRWSIFQKYFGNQD